jgi:hypothetical protein
MLRELLERGRTGWVVYMDADAYIVNQQFDLRSYLERKSSLAAVLTPGTSCGWWDVNAGVFAINLDCESARALIVRWNEMLNSVPDECFQLDAGWGEGFPEDQNMLHSLLQEKGFSRSQFHIECHGLMNSPFATFIRTCMRAHSSGGIEDRLLWIQHDIEGVENSNK